MSVVVFDVNVVVVVMFCNLCVRFSEGSVGVR